MKYFGKRSLSSVINVLIVLAMIGGVVILATLPLTLKHVLIYFQSRLDLYTFYLIILYCCGACLLGILNELRVIFTSLSKADPFVWRNVMALKRVFYFATGIFIVSGIKIFIDNSLMTMCIVFVFFVAGLFSLVLSEVFRKAVEYKEDNDLTI